MLDTPITMSHTEQCNRLSVEMSKKDTELSSILSSIDQSTKVLLDDIDFSYKYKAAVSVEYLLVRARILVESEHITVKRVLSDVSISNSLRNIFLRRNTYLADVSMKLTNIQNDLSILQKIVYTNSNFIKK